MYHLASTPPGALFGADRSMQGASRKECRVAWPSSHGAVVGHIHPPPPVDLLADATVRRPPLSLGACSRIAAAAAPASPRSHWPRRGCARQAQQAPQRIHPACPFHDGGREKQVPPPNSTRDRPPVAVDTQSSPAAACAHPNGDGCRGEDLPRLGTRPPRPPPPPPPPSPPPAPANGHNNVSGRDAAADNVPAATAAGHAIDRDGRPRQGVGGDGGRPASHAAASARPTVPTPPPPPILARGAWGMVRLAL